MPLSISIRAYISWAICILLSLFARCPATTELLWLSKDELSHLSQAYREVVLSLIFKQRIANMISPDKKSRRVLHSHEKRSRRVSWSSYFPFFSRKNTATGYTRHFKSLGDVLGAWTEISTPAAHLWSWYINAKFKNSNQYFLRFCLTRTRAGRVECSPWSRWSRSQSVRVENKILMDSPEIRKSQGTWDSWWRWKYWAYSTHHWVTSKQRCRS